MGKADRERKDAANRVAAEVRSALARADATWRQWELAGGALVPQAEQALNSSLKAYQTGKGEFMPLLDAYRAALGARLERDMAAAKVMQGRADLERAVGMDLDSIPGAAGKRRREMKRMEKERPGRFWRRPRWARDWARARSGWRPDALPGRRARRRKRAPRPRRRRVLRR